MRTQPPSVTCLAWLLCFYLYFRHSREHTLVIAGQALGEATVAHSASALLLRPGLPSTRVSAHCGPNELPEAQAEYLMRLLSVNGYCDQGRVPAHLAEGLHNSRPTAGPFSPAGASVWCPVTGSHPPQRRTPARAHSSTASPPALQPRDSVSMSPELSCSSNQR